MVVETCKNWPQSKLILIVEKLFSNVSVVLRLHWAIIIKGFEVFKNEISNKRVKETGIFFLLLAFAISLFYQKDTGFYFSDVIIKALRKVWNFFFYWGNLNKHLVILSIMECQEKLE